MIHTTSTLKFCRCCGGKAYGRKRVCKSCGVPAIWDKANTEQLAEEAAWAVTFEKMLQELNA